jgi:predicted Zn finger-like uncharacterized protein
MYTRCPECETTFKLSAADLRRAQGKVRCGDCNFVFNAIEYLAEEADDQTGADLPVLAAKRADTAENLPTEDHILSPGGHADLPTVTMETIAPQFEDALPPELTGEDTVEANLPVVDLPAEPEFQEGTFGSADDEAWSVPAPDLPENDTPTEHIAATNDTATEGFVGPEADDAVDDSDQASVFDDAIWEKIPGVGASDEDWESVKSGSHKQLAEEEQLADGLSYTDTRLPVISLQPPLEDFIGALNQEEDTPPLEDELADEPADNFPAEAQTMPATAEVMAEVAAEVAAEVEVDIKFEAETEFDKPQENTNFEDTNFDVTEEKWNSFFGAEAMDELAGNGEPEMPAEAELIPAISDIDESDSEHQTITEFCDSFIIEDESLAATPEPAVNDSVEIAAEPEQPATDNTQDAADVAEAEHKQADTSINVEVPDSSKFKELNENPESAQAESADILITAMNAVFCDVDQDDADIIEPQAEFDADDEITAAADFEQNTASTERQDAPHSKDFDPLDDTWTGRLDIEEVVLATGIFDAEKIELLRQRAIKGGYDPAVPQEDEAQPQEDAETEAPEGSPARQAESADVDVDIDIKRARKKRSPLLVAVVALLVIGFPLQLIHYNRDSLAAHPSWGETVRNVYARLNLPLYPLWSLDNYEIRGHEAVAGESGQDVLDIRTEIAMVGKTAASLPRLRVVLRDRWSNPLAASTFTPQEYADTADLPANGMLQPNQKFSAHVSIVDPGTGAQGYELELCLPRRNTGLVCTDQPFK